MRQHNLRVKLGVIEAIILTHQYSILDLELFPLTKICFVAGLCGETVTHGILQVLGDDRRTSDSLFKLGCGH